MRAGPNSSGFPRIRPPIHCDALCARSSAWCASSRSVRSYLRDNRAAKNAQSSSWPMVIPINMFAAGPVRDATRRTTFSPDVQHWWCTMASNCISHGRKCADTVPLNIGTFGLDALHAAVLFSPLLVFIVIPIPYVRMVSTLVSALSARVASVGVAWITGDKENCAEFRGCPRWCDRRAHGRRARLSGRARWCLTR